MSTRTGVCTGTSDYPLVLVRLFQRAMDTILQGLPGVVCYQDDIFVTGKEIDEHLKNLEQVFGRLKQFGLRLRLTKCKFLKESVEYQGHVISRN